MAGRLSHLSKSKTLTSAVAGNDFSFAGHRMGSQLITRRTLSAPAEVVAWLGAVQAQDYEAAKWAVGLRLPDNVADDEMIESAISEGSILRTHIFRGTWHLVSPSDIRWMLKLVAPRQITRLETRHRQLGLDANVFRRSNDAFSEALRDGSHLTRDEMADTLKRAGISEAASRLSHLLMRAELDSLICSGARRGKQATYALLDFRAPGLRAPYDRLEGLAEIARRYFRSRGPATLGDFAWWTGLNTADARAGLQAVQSTLVSEVVDGKSYWLSIDSQTPGHSAFLLPAFDEYLVAYRNRDAVLDPEYKHRINSGGGMLRPCIIVDGIVIGIWRRSLARGSVSIDLDMFEPATARVSRVVEAAARRYGEFLGLRTNIACR